MGIPALAFQSLVALYKKHDITDNTESLMFSSMESRIFFLQPTLSSIGFPPSSRSLVFQNSSSQLLTTGWNNRDKFDVGLSVFVNKIK